MSRQHLQHLMREIGPLLDLAEVIEYPDQALWLLVRDAGSVIEVELDEARARLTLSMELGTAPDDPALHRTLLQYNYLWRHSGGMRMALAGDTLVQLLELSVPGLDSPTLARVLDNLQDNATLWRQLLSAPPQPTPDDTAPPPGGPHLLA